MRYETIPTLSVWISDSSTLSSGGRVAAMKAMFEAGNPGKVPLTPRPADLKPIDDLIALYEKAWSVMAKRNIVVDLNRAIAGWRRLHPGPQDVSISAIGVLQDVVDRILRASPSTSKYSHVICAGWGVGCNYDASTGRISRNSLKNKDYFCHSDDDEVDALGKCSEMATAVRAARSAISTQGLTDNSQTLKVFMGPEFFFRGKNGAYSPDIVSDIMPRLLASLGPGWSDWLFVFGTAVASIVDEVTYCGTCGHGNSKVTFQRDPLNRQKTIPKCDKDTGAGPAHVINTGAYGAEVQNVALVHHAGESYVVVKEYVSGIDYKNRQVTVQPGTPDERTMRALSPQGGEQSRIQSVFDDERMGGCILNIAGLTVGLEVCLDHIASSQPNLGRASRYAGTIQLLLIPSYGMQIGTGLYCRSGGVVFNVDGRGHGRSHLVQKGATGTPPKKTRIPIASGSGAIEVWEPLAIPQ